ncbi:MAG: helix-turn-helix transcriptional regulator [Clostridia bacterium]|nr:helix-turn-helix transcriptional regulator [Clostridia bacterium]
MALSEKLYELRKKGGLSQEQLAEQLGVSRQAVSKWESGKAVPESDTLISISRYYNVSLDYLMRENDLVSEMVADKEETQTKANSRREKRIFGIVTCLIGIVCLLAWGIVSIFMPTTSDRIGTSSMITIDGNGVFLIICLAAIIIGAVLLLKSSSDK